MVLDQHRHTGGQKRNIVPIKSQSPKYRIDGTASLLDAYVGLYEHFNEYRDAL